MCNSSLLKLPNMSAPLKDTGPAKNPAPSHIRAFYSDPDNSDISHQSWAATPSPQHPLPNVGARTTTTSPPPSSPPSPTNTKPPGRTKGMKYNLTKDAECPICRNKYSGYNSLRNHIRKLHKIRRPASFVAQLRKEKDGRRKFDRSQSLSPAADIPRPPIANTDSFRRRSDEPIKLIWMREREEEAPQSRNRLQSKSFDAGNHFVYGEGGLSSKLGRSLSSLLEPPFTIDEIAESARSFSGPLNSSNQRSWNSGRPHPYVPSMTRDQQFPRRASDILPEIPANDVESPLSEFLLPHDVFSSGPSRTQKPLPYPQGVEKNTSRGFPALSLSADSVANRSTAFTERGADDWTGADKTYPFLGTEPPSSGDLNQGLQHVLSDPAALAREISEILKMADSIFG